MEGASIESVIEKIGGLDIEIVRRGRGRPVLFLHPHIGFWGAGRFVDAMAKHAEVIAPAHPGFGRSALAKGMTTVDDLSYFYLDLLEQLDLRDVVLVGASFGGWLAAAIATKTCERLARLVMLGAVGVKLAALEVGGGLVPRSGARAARLLGAARRGIAGDGAQPRGDRALRLEPVHVRPEALRPAAPHPHPDLVSVGRGRPLRARGLRPRLLRGGPRRRVRGGRGRGPLPAHRAARGGRRPDRRVRARQAAGEAAMRIYQFSEQPYPDAWENPSIRVNLASRAMDPKVMAQNYHDRLDEWLPADEDGLDIMINEHHATA